MPILPRFQPFLILLLAAGLASPAASDAGPAPRPPQPAPRPRIAVALGGGSARGLAHLGVLEWLHEHRIPVDIMVGTSMGGLVGGTFATGLTAPEVTAVARAIDWDEAMATGARFEDSSFRRKQDRRAFPSGLEVSVRRGLSLPRSLNQGQHVALLIDRITAAYSGVRNFDDLPTPFRCVAFDVNRAERVVLGSGILPEALRATMALPAIFPPVTIDGRLLIDGGTADNVPADVARDLKADFVIAVDVSAKPTEEGNVTALSMINRTIDAVVLAGTRKALPSADVVITPDMKNLTGLDWSSLEDLRARGYRATQAQAATLLQHAVSPEEYDAYLAARRARRQPTPIVPVAIGVDGVPVDDRAAVARRVAATPGRALDLDQLELSLLRLSGTDRFELLTYNLAPAEGGQRLEIHAPLKANGPAFLKLGLELNNTVASAFSANLAGRATVFDAFGRGSEVRLDFVVGTTQSAGAEVYRPIGPGPVFVAPRVFVDHGPRSRFAGGREVGEYGLTRAGAALDVGVEIGRVAEVRAGVGVTHVAETLRVGDPALPGLDGVTRDLGVQAVLDTQDSPVVPSRGVFARARARRLFDAPDLTGPASSVAGIDNPTHFWQAEFEVSLFHPVARRDRVFLHAAGGTSFGAHPYDEQFSLGGPFRLSAFRNDELTGASYTLAGAGYMRHLSRLPSWFGNQALLAIWGEAGKAFDFASEPGWHGDAVAGVIVDSIFGPIFAGGSIGSSGHRRLYVSLGPLFR